MKFASSIVILCLVCCLAWVHSKPTASPIVAGGPRSHLDGSLETLDSPLNSDGFGDPLGDDRDLYDLDFGPKHEEEEPTKAFDIDGPLEKDSLIPPVNKPGDQGIDINGPPGVDENIDDYFVSGVKPKGNDNDIDRPPEAGEDDEDYLMLPHKPKDIDNESDELPDGSEMDKGFDRPVEKPKDLDEDDESEVSHEENDTFTPALDKPKDLDESSNEIPDEDRGNDIPEQDDKEEEESENEDDKNQGADEDRELPKEKGSGEDTDEQEAEEDKIEGGLAYISPVFHIQQVHEYMTKLEAALDDMVRDTLEEVSHFNGTTTNITEEVEEEDGTKFKVQSVIKVDDKNNTEIIETVESEPELEQFNRTKRSNWLAQPVQ